MLTPALRRRPSVPPMAVWVAEPSLHANQSLANELIQILLMKTGRQFFSPQNPQEWSKIVWICCGLAWSKYLTGQGQVTSNSGELLETSCFFPPAR